MNQTTFSATLDPLEAAAKTQAPMARSAPAGQDLVIDIAIAAAYVALVAAWSLLIPFNGAPDELSHMFLVEHLFRFGTIPEPQVDPVTPYIGMLTGVELKRTIVWYHGLPFAHALGGAVFADLFSFLLPTGRGYLAARLFNWILGGIFVFTLIRAILGSGLPGSAARLIAVLIATIPQVTFIFAYFNHDAFGLVAVALALHAFLRIVKHRGSVSADAAYFGAVCGLILLSKPYYYPALVFFSLMLVFFKWSDSAFPLGAVTLRAIVTAILAASPILAWTVVEFGEITAGKLMQYYLSVHPELLSRKICYVFCDGELVNWDGVRSWSLFSFISFFGVLGWMDLFLPNWIYRFWFAPLTGMFVLFSLILIVRRVSEFWSGEDRTALFDAAFVTLTILMHLGTTIMSLVWSQIHEPQPQGRYLFVVLPLVAYCLALFATTAQSILTSGSKFAASNLAASRYLRGGAPVVGILASLTAGMLILNIYAALFVLSL